MDIFVVTGTHFSQPGEVMSFHADERFADVFATDLVNVLRADLDPETLQPVDVSSWRLGLVAAQCRRLAMQGIDIGDIDHTAFADTAGFDVWVEKVEAHGLSALAVDDRELATVLAALRGHQRRTCPPDLLDIATNGGRYVPLTSEEIDGLCERLNCGILPPPEVNIVVELDGGLVEGVVADRPTKVRVVDYDVEGADPDNLVMVPRDHGGPIPASVSDWAVESDCIDPAWIDRLDAASAAEAPAAASVAGE
ncbi:hypothetical protein NOLU111490_12290 [Novosphingobium lubricantis]|uniref:hypothetical protein n=1 Tax=Novosphingobium sp. CCH12-A3 TaxID=1768752 RepID=UPI000781F931|nr:hypothetical protein [Novosphingobium sp. CCH12-A3]